MPANRLARTLQPLEHLPAALRVRARSLVMGQIGPVVGTARLRIEELSDRRAVVSVQNRRRVQNHLHTVHAAAMALIAETASGFVVGMNVPDDRVPVIKSMRVDFLKRARGAMRAVAELTDEQCAAIAREQKGEVTVQVRVEDGEGKEPIACAMLWAWTPKRR
jgi:acyl-coenzyme A thioesterase PaaI-like protein